MKFQTIIIIKFTIIFILLNGIVLAQNKPWSMTQNIPGETEYLKCSENNILPQNINQNEGAPMPFRFADLKEVHLSCKYNGKWDTLTDGRIIWRAGIVSSGAFSLNFNFSTFDIPEEAMVYVYSPGYEELLGAFTMQDFRRAGTIGVSPIAGDRVIIEYNQPAGILAQPNIEISKVGHDFTNTFGKKSLMSGSCNVNINCVQGADWQVEKNAVVHLVILDQYVCTGSLINNTSYDAAPYVLTANHCISTYNAATNTEFVFNYEYADCEGTQPLTKKYIYGSDLIATGKDGKIDFSLVKMKETPPEDFSPFYAGWNRSILAANSAVAIHHPSGDYKKISVEEDPVISGDYGYGFLTNSHWHIQTWEVGTTEGGSSGGPLFDQNHLIVGDLTGGEAYCGNSVNDYYSKFSVAWDHDSDPFYQLKTWLDPLSTGTESLQGYSPFAANLRNDISVSEVLSPGSEVCQESFLRPKVYIRNIGIDTITSFVATCLLNGSKADELVWEGKLMPNTKIEILFDTIRTDFGQHQFIFYTSLPNRLTDSKPLNDTIYFDFNYRNSQKVDFRMKTDDWPEETTWQLSTASNNLIASNGRLAANQLYHQAFCLDEGCYVFKIADKMNDGFCESGVAYGNYSLTNSLISQTYAADSCFESEQVAEFCIIPIYKKNYKDKLVYSLFPNPATDVINLNVSMPDLVQIQVMDLNGKIVSTKIPVSGNNQIDVSHLSSGIYIIKFIGKSIIYTDKFIIQN